LRNVREDGSDAQDEWRRGGRGRSGWRRIREQRRERSETRDDGRDALGRGRWRCQADIRPHGGCGRHAEHSAIVSPAVVARAYANLRTRGRGGRVVATLRRRVMSRQRFRCGGARHRAERPGRRQGGHDGQDEQSDALTPTHGPSITRGPDRADSAGTQAGGGDRDATPWDSSLLGQWTCSPLPGIARRDDVIG
jgi:hypothetical protein